MKVVFECCTESPSKLDSDLEETLKDPDFLRRYNIISEAFSYKGYYDTKTNTIGINMSLGSFEKVITLVHELGHYLAYKLFKGNRLCFLIDSFLDSKL